MNEQLQFRRLSSKQRPEQLNVNFSENRTHSSDGNSLLYKYGQELNAGGLSSSIPPLGTASSLEYSSLQESVKQNDEDTIFSQITSLSKIRPKTLKVVSGSQFRLTTKAFNPCDQCEVLDKANKKNKELIRTLKLQLLRMEESFKDLKYSRSLEQALMETKPSTDSDSKTVDGSAPSRKVERLEEEVIKLKKMLTFERNTTDALRQSLDEQRAAFDNEMMQLRAELERSIKSNSALSTTIHGLEENLLNCNHELEELKHKLDQNQKVTLSRQNSEDLLSQETQKLKKEIEKLDSINKSHLAAIQQKSALIGQLEAKIQSQATSVANLESQKLSLETDLSTMGNNLKSAQDQIQNYRKKIEGLELGLKTVTQERDNMKTVVSEKENVILDKTRKIEALEAEIRNQNMKMNDFLKRVAAESETTKKALEKSISSSVRLCVVAPTVNVHVNEGKSKYKSRLSDAALRQFLQTEVFDKYCFLFKQSNENSSPTGENLETWLQKMLSQMQMSIENHVNSAMDGSSL